MPIRWDPHVVADYNDNDVMVVKSAVAFSGRSRPDTDDFLLALSGKVLLDVGGSTHRPGPGELVIVPKGETHRPRAIAEARVLLIEPKGTPITGDPATAARKRRI